MTHPVDSPLPDDLATAHRQIRDQAEELRKQQLLIDRMQHQIEQLLRQRYGKKSEKLDPAQMLLFTNDSEEVPLADLPVPPEAADSPATARSRGRKKLPADLPRIPKIYVLDEEARACPCCGKQRKEIGQETREQLDYKPASLHVVEHIRLKYACEDCQAHVATAPRLPEPIERGLPGTGLLAHVAVCKYVDHLPLYRQEGIFFREGVTLSRSTMCDWMASIAGLMEPIWKAMKARILLSDVIQTDDTPVSVQDLLLPGKNRTGRFWVYLGDRRNRFLVYDYSPNRGRDGPVDFLQDFRTGYLQSDAYSVYDAFHQRGLLEVACWAHARRKFYECRSTSPDYAHPALAWIGRLYDVEKAATAAIQKRLIDEKDLDDARRWAIEDEIRGQFRKEQSRPLMESFGTWLETVAGQVLPKSPMGQAVAYSRTNWTALNRYLEVPYLVIDNNASENALRSIAIGRKNWLHLGSDAGGRTAAILMTVLQSCKHFKFEPFAYLRDVLDRVSTHPHSRIAELLPDAWKPDPAKS